MIKPAVYLHEHHRTMGSDGHAAAFEKFVLIPLNIDFHDVEPTPDAWPDAIKLIERDGLARKLRAVHCHIGNNGITDLATIHKIFGEHDLHLSDLISKPNLQN